MMRVVGVRFRTAGKIYFFDPGAFDLSRGTKVIVETARGIEFGTVVGEIREVEDKRIPQPLKPVLRIATQRDHEQEAGNKVREREAFRICLEKIRKHELDMKLIDAEYTFDNNKVLFYFTADGRIDFRELVKDLAGVFKTRIELRQIGVRDETKIRGGIGICGRPLCCHTHLSDFMPVSIKMAKEQNLSLNPTKISGVCGRLMCCLTHEEETYEELNRILPGVGDTVTTEDGLSGEVQSVNVLRRLVKVIVTVGDEKEIREYEAGTLQFTRRKGGKNRKDNRSRISREELKELERLEKEEAIEKKEIAGPEDAAGKKETGGKKETEEKKEGAGKRDGTSRRDGSDKRDGANQRDGAERRDGSWRRQEKGNRPHNKDNRSRQDRGSRQGGRQGRGENHGHGENQGRGESGAKGS